MFHTKHPIVAVQKAIMCNVWSVLLGPVILHTAEVLLALGQDAIAWRKLPVFLLVVTQSFSFQAPRCCYIRSCRIAEVDDVTTFEQQLLCPG